MSNQFKLTVAQLLSSILIFYFKLRYFGKVTFGRRVILNHRFKFRGPGKLYIADNSNLWAHAEPNQFHTYAKEAVINVGPETRLNGIQCHCAKQITIGRQCLIGSATIMDTDFHSWDDPEHVLYGAKTVKPVSIGDSVWLAGQSVVLKGVQIGCKSVVGFRSVVAKNVPANVVVVGNPAQVVKSHHETNHSSSRLSGGSL